MSSELFAEKLKQWVSNQPNDSNRYVTDEEHAEMVKKLLKFSKEEEKPRSSKEYRWVRSLAVVRYGGDAYKVVRKAGGLEILPASRLFEVIHEAHLISGHAGRDKPFAILKKKIGTSHLTWSECTCPRASSARKNALALKSTL